jgi:hypothetical protein
LKRRETISSWTIHGLPKRRGLWQRHAALSRYCPFCSFPSVLPNSILFTPRTYARGIEKLPDIKGSGTSACKFKPVESEDGPICEIKGNYAARILSGQVHFGQKFRKPRVLPQRVEMRIAQDGHHHLITLLDSPVKPLEGCIDFPKPEVHMGKA